MYCYVLLHIEEISMYCYAHLTSALLLSADGVGQHGRRSAQRPSPFKLWPEGMGMESQHGEMGRKRWQTRFQGGTR